MYVNVIKAVHVIPTAGTLGYKNLEAFSIKSMRRLSNEEIKGVQLKRRK